jgi:hypothetical protein
LLEEREELLEEELPVVPPVAAGEPQTERPLRLLRSRWKQIGHSKKHTGMQNGCQQQDDNKERSCRSDQIAAISRKCQIKIFQVYQTRRQQKENQQLKYHVYQRREIHSH